MSENRSKHTLSASLAPTVVNGQRFNMTAEIHFPHPMTVFVLEGSGGVSPLAFCNSSTLLLDRMIVSHARRLHKRPDHPNLQGERWWLDTINTTAIRFNVVLAAVEGSAGRFPSPREFSDEVEAATAAVACVLTEASPVRYTADQMETIYQMFASKQERYRKEVAFLIAAVPLLRQRVSQAKLLTTEQQLLAIADEQGLPTMTLSVLATLSCLYESNDVCSIGRRVVKPKEAYVEGDAHNTLSDLHSLEFLISTQGLEFSAATGICTCDEALMCLWDELSPEASGQRNTTFRFNAKLTRNLFGRLDEEEHALLVQRLRTRG